MRDHLFEIGEVAAKIKRGEGLLLAGDEALLRQLPRGNWIGGTIPYFMSRDGGVVDHKRIFVNELPFGLTCRGVRQYGHDTIEQVYADLPAGGFGVIIMPATSSVHLTFAVGAPNFDQFAVRPLVGWISGVHLDDLEKKAPLVFDGATGQVLTDKAVVMHVGLPRGKVAELGVLNIFRSGSGPTITFPATGFSASEVEVDGKRQNFAEYIKKTSLDTKLPLVADYCGTPINVSYQAVDEANGQVFFYAPVFAGVPYRHGAPVGDYVTEFTSHLPKDLDQRVAFSCNCILNFLFAGLEGKKTGSVACPITFGEIAYQLLNQTLAYVTIDDVKAA
jgi:Family of unknown function (DUF6976)